MKNKTRHIHAAPNEWVRVHRDAPPSHAWSSPRRSDFTWVKAVLGLLGFIVFCKMILPLLAFMLVAGGFLALAIGRR